MKATASDRLRKRVADWAVRLRVQPGQIRVQRMMRKWGSCSSAGRVTFSSDLARKRTAFQDYVIVHELLHLRIRNHGPLFRSTLRAYLGDNPWVTAPAGKRRSGSATGSRRDGAG